MITDKTLTQDIEQIKEWYPNPNARIEVDLEIRQELLDKRKEVEELSQKNTLLRDKVEELEKRLEEINNIIFSKGLKLGSDEYFKVRTLCTQNINTAEK